MKFPVNPNTGSHVQSLVLDGVTEPTLAGQLIVSSACTEVRFITGPQTIYIQKKKISPELHAFTGPSLPRTRRVR